MLQIVAKNSRKFLRTNKSPLTGDVKAGIGEGSGGEILCSRKLVKIPKKFFKYQNPHFQLREKLIEVALARGNFPDMRNLWCWQFQDVAKNVFKLL